MSTVPTADWVLLLDIMSPARSRFVADFNCTLFADAPSLLADTECYNNDNFWLGSTGVEEAPAASSAG